MASGCLVLVDGWNHYLAAQRCFGYDVARKFPVDRLAKHVAAAVEEDTLTKVVVVMALPDEKEPGEEPEYWAWRNRLKKLRNYGVEREKKGVRFSYHPTVCSECANPLDRKITCPACGRSNPVAGRRMEKGADVKIAVLALEAAWREECSTLVLFSQDSDYGPLVDQLVDVHKRQGRRYNLFSVFPVCGDPRHNKRGIPRTRWLPLDAETYAKLVAQPFAHVSAQPPEATPGSPDT